VAGAVASFGLASLRSLFPDLTIKIIGSYVAVFAVGVVVFLATMRILLSYLNSPPFDSPDRRSAEHFYLGHLNQVARRPGSQDAPPEPIPIQQPSSTEVFSKEVVLDRVTHVTESRRIFDTTTRRLLSEIGSLTRRGNLNLAIGVFTTAAAIGVLAYMALKAPPKFENLADVLSHYVPRVMTVGFVEVFSFFFLRLYRNGLAEMRYYQDQLTELSRKEAALEAALATEDLETQKKVIHLLAGPSKSAAPEPEGASLKEVGEFIERVGKIAIDAGKKPKD